MFLYPLELGGFSHEYGGKALAGPVFQVPGILSSMKSGPQLEDLFKIQVSSCLAPHKSLPWLLSALRRKMSSPLLEHQAPWSHLARYLLVVIIPRH